MRKMKLIIIVAIVALLAVGGAYASWTSRATISANASAGEMDVEISSISIGQVSEYVEFETDSITISEDKKSATVSIQNLYPGAEANATIVVTNIGTIPVQLSGASQVRELAVNTVTNANLSATDANMLIVQYTASADTKTGQMKASDSSAEASTTLFQNTSFVIEAGKTIEFNMHILLNRDASDETEKSLYQFQFIPMFVQANGESTGGESAQAGSSGVAQPTAATTTEQPSGQSGTTPEPTGTYSLEGLTVQNNGMLGAWNGSEEYSGGSIEITIPSEMNNVDIIRIGQNTFRAKNLVAVTFEDGSQVERIHARAFQGNQLTEIVLPDSLTRIDTRAFYDNPIASVIIPDGVITIENNAFNKLTSITVGSNLTDLKSGAINGNDAFKNAYLSDRGGAGTYTWDGKNWIKK